MSAAAERLHFPTSFASTGPAVVAEPASTSEIIQILNNTRRFPSPVRPIGSGSSPTRCTAASGGTLMKMAKMNRVLEIGEDTVTVQPGIRLAELAQILHDEGLELLGGFDLANRSVGGAVCSAGLEASMSGDVGQFAGHVTRLKVISPEGRKFVVSESTKSLLALMRLSYGLLGIVYEITLRVRPIQGFAVQSAKVSFKDFTKLGEKITATRSGVKVYLLPFRDRVYFELRKPDTGARTGRKYAWRFKDWTVYSALPGLAKSLAWAVPIRPLRYPLIDSLSLAAQTLGGSTFVRNGSNATEQSGRFRTLDGGRFTYCTWAFPAARFGDVAARYKMFSKAHYARTGFRCDMPTVGFRLNQDRTGLLSPSFDGPMLTLSPLSTQSDGWEDFALDFAEFAMGCGGVPLFNQSKSATPASAAKAYGSRLTFFDRVRTELDPYDRLLNQYFAAYFAEPGVL